MDLRTTSEKKTFGDHLARIGRFFFAISMMAFGVQQFIYARSGVGLEFVSARIPGHEVLAYLSGLILYVCGMSIGLKSRARVAALILSAFFLLCELFLQLPMLLANMHDLIVRTTAFETFALLGGALFLTGTMPVERLSSRRWVCATKKMKTVGRWFFAISLVIFGISHIEVASYVATLIPAWIPWPMFWVYFTAFGFMSAAISILLQQEFFFTHPVDFGALFLAGMFFLWVVLLHAPRVAHHLHNGNEWNSAFVALAMSGCALLFCEPRVKQRPKPRLKVKRGIHPMETFVALVIFACFASAPHAYCAATSSATPVLVELFTSEGCSSCPLAEAFVQQLNASQPIPGAQLIRPDQGRCSAPPCGSQ